MNDVENSQDEVSVAMRADSIGVVSPPGDMLPDDDWLLVSPRAYVDAPAVDSDTQGRARRRRVARRGNRRWR